MKTIMKWLDGNKTYLGMMAGGTLGILWNYGIVDDKLATTLGSLITTWTGLAFRHAIKKTETPHFTEKR